MIPYKILAERIFDRNNYIKEKEKRKISLRTFPLNTEVSRQHNSFKRLTCVYIRFTPKAKPHGDEKYMRNISIAFV
jgi:hypothetical protein